MGRPKTIITKAELAAVLGLSKARISQLCKREDFPVRPDGRVSREAAVRWYKDAGLADRATKRGPKRKQPKAAAVPSVDSSEPTLEDYVRAGQRDVLDRLRAKAAELPRLLHQLGAPVPAILAAGEAFDALFWAALDDCPDGDGLIEELYGPCGPEAIGSTDAELASNLGIVLNPKVTEETDKLLQHIDVFFGVGSALPQKPA